MIKRKMAYDNVPFDEACKSFDRPSYAQISAAKNVFASPSSSQSPQASQFSAKINNKNLKKTFHFHEDSTSPS